MQLSVSALTIQWLRPELSGEEWEFFNHPAKQSFYQRHCLTWESISAEFTAGSLRPYPRSAELNGIPVLLAHHSYEDYSRYLAKSKRGYRLNYSRMENALQENGKLILPAPIILLGEDEALLFSGYRRLCLAWNYGMTPYVYVVPLGGV